MKKHITKKTEEEIEEESEKERKQIQWMRWTMTIWQS